MSAGVLLWACLAAGLGLATPDELAASLDRLGEADLALMTDPAGARPVHVLLASKVMVPVEKLRRVVADPTSYRRAMPAFRRTDVVARRSRPGATDVQIAWELEVPAWNFTGKLWMRPTAQGVDLELAEGDLAPGLFHVKALPGGASGPGTSILSVDGYANLGNANWALRKLVHRSNLLEPAMTVAAAYVMLRGLAGLAEHGGAVRPSAAGAPMSAADLATLQGLATARAAGALAIQPKIFAAVRRRPDGRLARVEVALPIAAAPEDASGKSLHPEAFRGLPGWKKVTPVTFPDECKAASATCWSVDSNLPFFAIGGVWKLSAQPWRARMVAGESKGAVLGLDFVPGPGNRHTTLVLSQHPRIDQSGYLPRKLVAAEPLLEHGMSLALSIVEAVALAPALEGF